MKKECFCSDCNKKFSCEIKTIDDLNHLVCPICGKIVDKDAKPFVLPSRGEMLVDKTAKFFLNFCYYFNFLCSSLGLLCYFLGNMSLMYIFSLIMLVFYVIELLLGFDRNIFGIIGVFVFSIGGFYFFSNSVLGLSLGCLFCFLISSVIKIIINLVLRKLFRKYR